MTAYALRRLLLAVPVLFGVSVLVFLVVSLIPGDPALAILGTFATPENVAKLNAELGLDRPLPVRFVMWLKGVLTGDLGRSYALDRPVAEEVMDRLGPTLILASAALGLSVFFGIAAGVVSAVRQNTRLDGAIRLLLLVGVSTPSFFLGIMLIQALSARLGLFPTGGMTSLFGSGGLADLAHHLVLPAVTLAVVATAIVGRIARASMLEVLRQDFIRTARAKGLTEERVIGVHALKSALVAVVPVIGLQAGYVLGGAVYVETVFQWPGVGRMLVEAIGRRDILLAQGGVLAIAALYVLVNIATDLVQAALDPRIRR
ncbi:ABC transporter permease [Chelatococcus sambhunathii]|uniref:ABC transporter permease n=1 Tax=Chelatococcus sambhunathii TaxID=363953 RepID=A0ABU1DIQ2_9HYPH|nr:ABC transporter permease [Chelatococcus sambhunathii]MDR4307974.1 ABC transporter permease [Chelatococcus sambhunathii]